MNLTENFAMPLVQENGNYFIGFCTHKLQTKDDGRNSLVSTPKYGMLFRPNKDGDSLYIGLCNTQGLPETDPNMKLEGLYFSDIDFTDECLTSFRPHSITSNNLNRYKSYHKGGFVNGKFQG